MGDGVGDIVNKLYPLSLSLSFIFDLCQNGKSGTQYDNFISSECNIS